MFFVLLFGLFLHKFNLTVDQAIKFSWLSDVAGSYAWTQLAVEEGRFRWAKKLEWEGEIYCI